MNLLDHHHPPVSRAIQWNSFHYSWLGNLADDLNRRLPPGCWADPWVRLGTRATVALASDELEVLVYGQTVDGHRLVGAVEFLSPANKDRPDSRSQFVTKCQDYLAHGVGVILVDTVTDAHFNLHNELMARLGHAGDRLDGHLYAAAYRPTGKSGAGRLEMWLHPLAVGRPLPTVPLWLYGGICVPAELGHTYAAVYDKARLGERLGLLARANGAA